MTRPLHILFLLTVLLFGSCLESLPAQDKPDPEAVAALVALAQSSHEQADIAVDSGDLVTAEATMRDLLTRLDAVALDHPERDAQRLDAYGRLTRLLIDQNKIDDAFVTLEAGTRLAETAEPNIFSGYLFQIQAELFEQQGRPADAIASHKHAILIFQKILDRNSTTP